MGRLFRYIKNNPHYVFLWVFLVVLGVKFLLPAHVFGSEFKPVKCNDNGNYDNKYRCWKESVVKELENGSIPNALKQLDSFKEESPSFVSECHTMSHLIGEKAYKNFKIGMAIEPVPEMQICEFGFYHGFMTALMAESKDLKEAGTFCYSMKQKEDNGFKAYSRDACFHGIGHGSAASHESEEWKDPIAILRKGLDICHASARERIDFERCSQGIYNAFAYNKFYLEKVDKKDPFKLCREEIKEEDSPTDCYANFSIIVLNLTPHKDMHEAIVLANKYAPPKYLPTLIPIFANIESRKSGAENTFNTACLDLKDKQRWSCIIGYATGLIQGGIAEAREKKAYQFCLRDAMSLDDRSTCFAYSFDVLSDYWSKEKIENSCNAIPSNDGVKTCQKFFASWIIKPVR